MGFKGLYRYSFYFFHFFIFFSHKRGTEREKVISLTGIQFQPLGADADLSPTLEIKNQTTYLRSIYDASEWCFSRALTG